MDWGHLCRGEVLLIYCITEDHYSQNSADILILLTDVRLAVGECLPGALPFYSLSRLQPEIYPLREKAPQIDHDGLRTFPANQVAK